MRTDEVRENLKPYENMPTTRVLDGGYGGSGRAGIESWGDWELWVDMVDKQACPDSGDFVALAMHELAGDDWDETSHVEGMKELPGSMNDAGAILVPMSVVSWDAVLSKLAQNLDESMFGAAGTEPISAMQWQNDGNTQVYFVDVGARMYRCAMSTS